MNMILIDSAKSNLQQLSIALNQLSDELYVQSLDLLSGSTIGMHVRHIVEFYQCFLIGNKVGLIDYDARLRNLKIENSISYALHTMMECELELSEISKNSDLVLLSAQSVDDNKSEIPTNTFREITYLIEHTIHHMAIIKMAIKCNCPDLEMSKDFGVAYSTIKYQQIVHSNVSTAK